MGETVAERARGGKSERGAEKKKAEEGEEDGRRREERDRVKMDEVSADNCE